MAMVVSSQDVSALQANSLGEIIYGSAGRDRLWGTSDNDTIYGQGGDDVLAGGAGNDRIVGGAGTDTAVLFGRSSDYFIDDTANGIRVKGPDGTDTLIGIEVIAADDGTFIFDYEIGQWAKVSSTPGQALLAPDLFQQGTAGSDYLEGTADGLNTLVGKGGNDALFGRMGSDLLIGGNGNDSFDGDFGGLNLQGGNDRIYGGGGRDSILADGGNDRVFGGAGGDFIKGGDGNDTISGGAGADTFDYFYAYFRPIYETWGNDRITDFQLGTDKIEASSYVAVSYGLASNKTGDAVVQLISETGSVIGTITLAGIDARGLTLSDLGDFVSV